MEQEERIERGVFGSIEPSEVALSDLLHRYGKEITPSKRGAAIERYRLRRLINDPISSFSTDQITSQVLASFRDKRLKDGQRACQLDLILIRHCLRIAMSEWGLMLSVNPVDQIKKPPTHPSDGIGPVSSLGRYLGLGTPLHFTRSVITEEDIRGDKNFHSFVRTGTSVKA